MTSDPPLTKEQEAILAKLPKLIRKRDADGDLPNRKKELDAFNQQIHQFFKQDRSDATAVLRSHLIVEHFLDRYLQVANPTVPWGQTRLNFLQKLALADHPDSGLHNLLPGLRCLNKIRNDLTHKLDVDLDDTDLNPISSTFSASRAGEPLKGLELLQGFALIASSSLHFYTLTIERHAPGLGLAGIPDD